MHARAKLGFVWVFDVKMLGFKCLQKIYSFAFSYKSVFIFILKLIITENVK